MAVTLATTITDVSRMEDVSDVITMIDPTDTPIIAAIGEQAVDDPDEYVWQTDSLEATAVTGVVEGFAFSSLSGAVSERNRFRAICQIQAEGISISARREKTKQYGVESEMAYQLAKKSMKMKRSAEAVITTYRDPVVGTTSVAPLCSGIPSWIATNGDYGATGSAPGLAGSDPDEPSVNTDGTARALDESIILDLLGGVFDEGGNVDTFFMDRAAKQKMSQYFFGSSARIATPYQDHGANPSSGLQVNGAVDYYVSDFGVIALVPDRFMRSTDLLMLDTSTWQKGTFRNYEMHAIAKTGDSEEYMLLHDFTLIARAEEANARFAAVDTTAAMVA